jgi:hypothetical protein
MRFFVGIAVDLDSCSVRRRTGWDIHRMADWLPDRGGPLSRNADGIAAVTGTASLRVDPDKAPWQPHPTVVIHGRARARWPASARWGMLYRGRSVILLS